MKTLILIFCSLSLIACSKGGDDRVSEKEGIRAERQVEAENENRRVLNQGAERELNELKHYISAVEGRFGGEVQLAESIFDLTVELTPSMPIRFYDRVRNIEEIQFEKENLNVTVKIILESRRIENNAFTCVFEGHQPDIERGLMNLVRESCPNSLILKLSSDTSASDIRTNRVNYVRYLRGTFSTRNSSRMFPILLERI